jgi:hypothetical protein
VMPAMVGRHAPLTIFAWLHISGQKRRSKLVKLGNMAKQLFRSSHGALTFTGCVGEPRRTSLVVGRLKSYQDLPARECKTQAHCVAEGDLA